MICRQCAVAADYGFTGREHCSDPGCTCQHYDLDDPRVPQLPLITPTLTEDTE